MTSQTAGATGSTRRGAAARARARAAMTDARSWAVASAVTTAEVLLEVIAALEAAAIGAAREGAKAAAAIWAADLPRRKRVRTARRRRWWARKGWWRVLVAAELVAVVGWAGGRSAARVAWSAGRIRRQAARGARDGWTSTREQARTRRTGSATAQPTPPAGGTPAGGASSSRAGGSPQEVVVDVEVVCAWTSPDGRDCGAVLPADSTGPYCPTHRDGQPTPTPQPAPQGGAGDPSSRPERTPPTTASPTAAGAEGRTAAGAEGRPTSVHWSSDFDAYATGKIGASQIRCVLCEQAPCVCPPVGSAEYVALVRRRHGRDPQPDTSAAPSPGTAAEPHDQEDGPRDDEQEDGMATSTEHGGAAPSAAQRRTAALRGAGWTGPIDADGHAIHDQQPWGALSGVLTAIEDRATGPATCCRCVRDPDQPQWDQVANCRCVVGQGADRDTCTCGPWDLALAIREDDEAEDRGDIDGDDRATCHQCKDWADHAHRPFTNERISLGAYGLQSLLSRHPSLRARMDRLAQQGTTSQPPAGHPACGSAGQHDQHDGPGLPTGPERDDKENGMATNTVTTGTRFTLTSAGGGDEIGSTTVTSGPGGGVVHGGAGMGGQLTAIGDLRAEVTQAAAMAEQCEAMASRLAEWARQLPDKAKAADWRTAATDQATAAIAEAADSTRAMREQITGVLAAAADATRLGDVLASGGARGEARGLAPQ